jgi:hypothetical protein
MLRPASIIAISLALLGFILTAYLFNVAEAAQDRNTLLALLVVEGVFMSWVLWSFAHDNDTKVVDPITLPRSRPLEVIPSGGTLPPQPRPRYQHHPLQPTRPPTRRSDPLPTPPTTPRRDVTLPPIPELSPPQPGRSNSRIPTPAPQPNKPKAPRIVIRLDDLLPPAPPETPKPPIPPPPRPQPAPAPQGRPKRPRKYADFEGNSSELPAKLALTELKLCSDILSLGYACAASDGPVSSEEEDHLQGWAWCVIEHTADKDAAGFLQALTDTSVLCKTKGKQKLEAVTTLAESIRSTGEKKLIQAAAELCSEIVASDGRLEPGEFATLSAALKALGTKSVKAAKIAVKLIADDDEITEMLAELEINARTTTEERERKLSVAWSRENARMQAIADANRREEMRRRMELIQRIRDLYRELDQHG